MAVSVGIENERLLRKEGFGEAGESKKRHGDGRKTSD